MKRDITNIWKNIQELDLRPIRELAERYVKIALIGEEGVGKRTLAEQMRNDPDRPEVRTMSPLMIADLDGADQIGDVDMVILMVDATSATMVQEQNLLGSSYFKTKNPIIFYNKVDLLPGEKPMIPWLEASGAIKIYGSTQDRDFLVKVFAPAVIAGLQEYQLALGRRFPLFREPIARNLINDTCLANAAYSLGTGLAEIVPILDIPLNIADFIVLTKAQALLVYKLGLALGLSKDRQYYLGEFGSVVGSGFIWRQIARQLVGLIPVWGIVPKVAVAYSGTYVVGHVVLQWYLTGGHVSRKRMREISRQAFKKGKEVARNLLAKMPRPSLKRRNRNELPAPSTDQNCLNCGTANDLDANFCKNCGESLLHQAGKVK
jgi:uncharacterized protein (DUF697 family)